MPGDEFSRLRGEIYLSYAPGDPEGLRALVRGLSRSRAEADAVLEGMVLLRAASLRPGAAAPDEALERLPHLGRDPLLDRCVADALRGREGAEEGLRRRADQPDGERAAFACAGSAGLTPFDAGRTAAALSPDRDPETLVDVLGYAAASGFRELAPRIRGLLTRPLPWGVLEEARAALADLEEGPPGPSGSAATPVSGGAASLTQTLFHGDPTRPGRGSSGGVGTLVRELGAALTDLGLGVLSLVGYDSRECAYPYVARESAGSGGPIRRVPVYLSSPAPAGFSGASGRIARSVLRALRSEPARPGILHVRFLDDASRASALAARILGIPLAVTLTPDPHRSVCGPDGRIRGRSGEELRDLVNRIWIGDDLLAWARGVLAIGRNTLSETLIRYYPQLEDTRGRVFAGVDEGVRISVPAPDLDVPALLGDPRRDLGLDPAAVGRPALLSVGRLGAVKGQANLVRAWASRGLWMRYNLVLVGGDLENPSPEEHCVREEIRESVTSECRGRICHLPALPNEAVRALLRWFSARRPREGFDVYVCPSLKEEFGLSILEAMAEGLPVCAPLAGGPSTYIRNGVNGFLVDTRDAESLGRELRAALERCGQDPARVERIKREARRTVEERYSLDAMAREYADFYRRAIGTEVEK